jgi:hypothetical protein
LAPATQREPRGDIYSAEIPQALLKDNKTLTSVKYDTNKGLYAVAA